MKTVLLCILGTTGLAAAKPWVLRFDGAGPVKIGMTQDQLSAALSGSFSVPENAEEKNCFYAEPSLHPGIAFMVQNGRVTRADVTRRTVPTASGIRVGDSEEQVKKVYGARVKVEPHAYTGPEGHYLTVYSRDRRYGLRFETDGKKVTGFYAGEPQAILYIEGCH
ncbi:MAG TPA: hypothetical protein VFR84_07615 [Candidatus Angelobacter sp.]|nr:hypothetical protein [Candidatus Angelobacter sp.]